MANIKSAKKRIKTNEKARIRNKALKSRVKTFIKKVLGSLKEGNKEELQGHLKVAYKEIDKACTKGIFHKNKSSRIKSRLAKKVAAI